MNALTWTPELRFVVALALGFLIGLERESAKSAQHHFFFGGVRTHPILSLFGFGAAWLFQVGATLVLPAALASVAALTAISYLAKVRQGHYGSTTEISALLTFVTGALALLVDIWAAMSLGIVNAILLSEKAALETYVERLNRVEFLAVLKFLLVTVIILPVLPDQGFTQFDLNPRRIWQIVVLVSSIGFVGYFLSKRFGSRVGLWLSGMLGGIVSSTAVTVSAGRLAGRDAGQAHSALQAALLAAVMMYARMYVIIALLNAVVGGLLLWRLGALAAVGLLLAATVRRERGERPREAMAGLQNPFEVTPALLFAGLFVVLLVATGFVQRSAGTAGTMVMACVVGVVDIDPFILSVVQPSAELAPAAAGAVLLAAMSNTLAKGVYFGVFAPPMRREAGWRYGLWTLLHLPLVFLW